MVHCVYAYHCAQLSYTVQHRSSDNVRLSFRQSLFNAQMLSTGGRVAALEQMPYGLV